VAIYLYIYLWFVRFDVLTAVTENSATFRTENSATFRDVTPYSLTEGKPSLILYLWFT
jgi:hypothetical protein